MCLGSATTMPLLSVVRAEVTHASIWIDQCYQDMSP